MKNIQKKYAILFGIIIGLFGIWGFFGNRVLGIFGVNIWQSILYLVAAFFGIYVGIEGEGYGFNGSIGWIGTVLGIFGFIPEVNQILANLFNINLATSALHLVLGLISLGVYYFAAN